MKNRVIKLLCIVLSMVTFLYVITIGAFATAESEIILSIEFEKEEYLPGEEVKASLVVCGIEGKSKPSYLLGAFEAHILLDSNLEFVNAEYCLDSKQPDDIRSIDIATDPQYSDIIVAVLVSESGEMIDLSDGSFVLAELYFKVNENASGQIALGFEEWECPIIFELPKTHGYTEIVCENVDDTAFISEYDYIIENSGASIQDNKVSDVLTVRKTTNAENAILIAGLYKFGDNHLIAQKYYDNVNNFDSIPVDFIGIMESEKLEIRYFLWNMLYNPILPRIDVLVN